MTLNADHWAARDLPDPTDLWAAPVLPDPADLWKQLEAEAAALDRPDPADLWQQLEAEAVALVAFLEPIDLAAQLEREDHARLDKLAGRGSSL